MKKLVYIGIITMCLAITGFYSCEKKTHQEVSEKENLENSKESNNINSKSNDSNPFKGLNEKFDNWFSNNSTRLEEVTRDEILSFEDEEVRVMIFNVIPPNRKAFVWNEKYDELLRSNLYNEKQREFIISIRNEVQEEFYSNPQLAKTKLKFFNTRRKFGSSLFEDVELRSIMINLDNIAPAIASGGGKICKCSEVSDWCGSPIDAGDCSGACGSQSSSGCGTLWGYPCDGRCRFNVDPIK